MRYSKAQEQPQSSARPICHSHAMTSTGRRTSHHTHCCIGARCSTHCAMGDDRPFSNFNYGVGQFRQTITTKVVNLEKNNFS